MTVYRALVTPVEGTIVATPSDVRQMLVRVGGSVSVSGGTGSSTLAGLTDVALDGSPTAGQMASFDAAGKLTNTDRIGAVFRADFTFWTEADMAALPGQIMAYFVGKYGGDAYGSAVLTTSWFVNFQPVRADNGFFRFTAAADAESDPGWERIGDLPGDGDLVIIGQALSYDGSAFIGGAEQAMVLIGLPQSTGGATEGVSAFAYEQLLPRPITNTSPPITQSGPLSDFFSVHPILAVAGDVDLTLPTDDSTGVYTNRVVYVGRIDGTANTVTLVGTIYLGATPTTDHTLAPGEWICMVLSPVGWIKLGGYGGASTSGLDETAVQALIDASNISIAKIVSDGMGTTLPDILVASTIARDTEVAAGDAATLASAESYTDTAVAAKVPSTRTIAGLDLSADRTAADVRTALGQEWQKIADVSLSGLATKDVDLTGYRAFRFRFRGASTIAGTSGSLKLRFNADSANNYASNTTNSSAFLLGNIPGTTTNTDRIRQVVGEFTLSDGTTWSVGSTLASGAGLSTDTAPAAASPVNCSYLSTSAITSLTLFTSGGENFSAASRLVVEALG